VVCIVVALAAIISNQKQWGRGYSVNVLYISCTV